ncbi:putative pre-mRNA splicing factor prp1 [Clavulina sp. PMI_390]|nr:putative pre-mRNA splicing factor prp1 [Clavulina sp. PMI_390]
MASKNKLAFLTMQAPASYVAGLGRGASGFTTRSDIGPAREGPSAEAIAEAQAKRGEEEPDPEQYQDPDNETGLFAGAPYEADDEEADQIYDHVDRRLDERRKAKREAREAQELAEYRAERPKLQTQFADLKRGLGSVTDAEWENLPEVGNLTGKKRKRDPREGRVFAVSDSILLADRERGQMVNSLDERQQQYGGFETPAEGGDGALTNLVAIGQARDTLLSLKLDQISDSVSGSSSTIDPKGYLTDLNSVQIKSEAEIGDIKRARMLFDSLVKSNPKHAPGWIAAACVEEHAGRMVAARKIIKAGCEQCPTNEDVWLESARLHQNDDAKVILAQAVQHLPHSVKIWIAAANLEAELKVKKRVLRKALEHIPNSVLLWKSAISLESSPEDARILLRRAVELLPHSVELWLALARLETPDEAQKVLNAARRAVKTSHEIWIAAAMLVEQQRKAEAEGDQEKGILPKSKEELEKELRAVDAIIAKAVETLRKNQVVLNRDQWLSEAEKCEAEGSPRTSEAIIKATVDLDVDEEDRESTWVADVESALSRGRITTARAILAYALKVFPDRRSLWRRAADMEKSHGTPESLEAILAQAVKYCPQSEVLWLMSAKEKWLAGDIEGARAVLEAAFDANPESEQIWLAAFKFESQNGQNDVARQLLERARSVANTERIWMKSAVFERQQGHLDAALQTTDAAIAKFPKFAKLYMIKGQTLEDKKAISEARAAYAAGMKACPKVPALWILASRLEEKDDRAIKARALLEKARVVNPKDESLWLEAVQLEERTSGVQQAKAVLARGIQDCPTSGLLHALSVMYEPRQARKTRSVDALKKSNDSPYVIATVARLFWTEGKVEKARDWFKRAVATNGDVGDCWGWWYRFEREHGTAEHQKAVVDACNAAEPRHGPVWQAVRKDIANLNKSNDEILELVAKKLK